MPTSLKYCRLKTHTLAISLIKINNNNSTTTRLITNNNITRNNSNILRVSNSSFSLLLLKEVVGSLIAEVAQGNSDLCIDYMYF